MKSYLRFLTSNEKENLHPLQIKDLVQILKKESINSPFAHFVL